MTSAFEIAVVAAAAVAAGACALRFLRVAQREHYLVGAPSRFCLRWWSASRPGPVLAVVALLAAVAAIAYPPVGLVTCAIVVTGPPGLRLRGRTGRLAWTRRLRLLAALTGVGLLVAPLSFALSLGLRAAAPAATLAALAAPLVVDAALVVAAPVEERFARRYVDTARDRLRRVAPRVVAITGSYGKTSTKGYVEGLLAGRFEVLASPRSYNNRAGLARTVNERLTPGTEVLVAEMGTYGPGEIAALCEWMPPEIAVITAIGPVHLERFRSLERTLAAKAEICERARAVVLNVDDERLAGLAATVATRDVALWRCSGHDRAVDVAVVEAGAGLRLCRDGRDLGELRLAPEVLVAPTNLACAVAVALALGIAPSEVVARVATLGPVESRLVGARTADGVAVLDDTFNANPAGARRALAALAAAAGPARRRVVVTPGMIELGALQREENARFAEQAAAVATDLVLVGRTNRAALVEGAARARPPAAAVHLVATREEAVAWVRAHLSRDDAVLYENDLPDHYP